MKIVQNSVIDYLLRGFQNANLSEQLRVLGDNLTDILLELKYRRSKDKKIKEAFEGYEKAIEFFVTRDENHGITRMDIVNTYGIPKSKDEVKDLI